jgi:predicted amidohydrolase
LAKNAGGEVLPGNFKKLRVGVAQLEVKLCAREENMKRVSLWMERNVKPSSLPTAIALPELWDVGYCLSEADRHADPGGRQAIEFLTSLARKFGVWLTSGSALVEEDGKFFNRTFVVNPSGGVVSTYDKAHLLPFITSERGILTGGNAPSLYDVEGSPCGSIICYDIRFPEWVRVYALSGIDVLFVCGQWTKNRMDLWRTMLRAHSIENTFYVVGVNCAGMSGDILYGGGSIVCAPGGEVLFEGSEAPDAGFVDLDLGALAQTREFLKVFESRVPELYGKLVEKPES